MTYVIGVDGGATKTLAVIGDDRGTILGSGLSGPSNYHIVGMESAMRSVGEATRKALRSAGMSMSAATRAVFGLGGADFPIDHERLTEACGRLTDGMALRVMNDSWIGLRGGTKEGWGVVVINGTGTNCAGRNPRGQQFILRSLGYEFGARGGGSDITRDALHHAFRSDEGTGPATALEHEIPRVLGLPSMAVLADLMFARKMNSAMMAPIVPLVFQLANQGDRVSQDILMALGDAMGQAAGGVARRLEIAGERFDVVLAGSVWHGENPLLRDQFTTALHRLAPKAQPQLPLFEPVVGAYLMALEDAGITITAETYERLAETASDL